ncbi:MAG: DNA polymerase III subunit gamma/tau [Candidatus Marinimicrobia bacterium CG08_land_8_20_14_0_20_45_22]|nr:MAG: DNA polymerase III subunit gamma/tau [Candidatus Marinimicrobia bacterium CG08_land_8_20_14_0_20_45_22]
MGYQVISRKYRPQRFDEIVGQEHICSTLQNAIRSGRISHAYLFTGSRGIGKTSMARILAKTLNCLNPQDNNPCNICQNCTEITSGRNIDVLEIDGASNRGIEEIRELRENVKYPPIHSNYRVYIIDEVHMLTKDAFNALLKTLEEPPPHAIFIFATTEPLKVLPTIISRCQRYDFHRIPVLKIVEQLKKIIESEKIQIPDDLLMLIAKKSDGGMRDAESMLDQVIAFSGEEVIPADVKKILGIIDPDYLFLVENLIFKQDQKGLLGIANEIFDNGADFGEFLTALSEHFRNLLVAKATESVEMLDLPDNVKDKYLKEKDKWLIGDLLRLTKIISEAQVNLKYAINSRTLLEFTLLRLGTIDKTVTVTEILESIRKSDLRIPNILTPKPIPQPEVELFTKQTPPAATKEINVREPKVDYTQPSVEPLKNSEPKSSDSVDLTFDVIESKWGQVLENLVKSNHSLSDFLGQGKLASLNRNVLEVVFDPSNSFARQSVVKRATNIEKIIEEIYHKPLKIKCVERKDKSEKPETSEIDKTVQTVLEIFDGEIVVT